tara:strand:+ start:2464 stop:4209 length:1746 start_codon:yes stop_codon:yes gene_type:complete
MQKNKAGSFGSIKNHLNSIYDSEKINTDLYARKIKKLISDFNISNKLQKEFNWSEDTVLLISYADSIYSSKKNNTLKTLKSFHKDYFDNVFDCVHILPFFPSSGDGGFSVMDHGEVDKKYGDWKDIKLYSKNKNIMADIVINHSSSKGIWFQNFLKGQEPGKNHFFIIEDKFDTTNVIRTRDHNLSQRFKVNGTYKNLWCTFSEDQIDLNFKNPDVLLDFIRIIIDLIDKGVLILRLDAVGFLWKETSTECLNLPQTHSIIKILRNVVDSLNIKAKIVTETNLPRKENLSYFGDSDEAHWIYNFSLAPLLVYTLLFENCSILSRWSKSMPPSRNGSAYLNFIASHDGLGMRPIEGILNNAQTKTFFRRIKKNGGKFSHRKFMKINKKVYESNISLFNVLKYSDTDLEGKYSIDRFIAAHCIMFAMEGIPAVYFNSMFGTEDDHERYKDTKHKRDLNRYKWNKETLEKLLKVKKSKEYKIYNSLTKILEIRKKQPAFHPNAIQFTLSLGDDVFGLWRQSIDRSQSIFSITNVTSNYIKFDLNNINLIQDEHWQDILNPKNEIRINRKIELKPFQSIWLTNKS